MTDLSTKVRTWLSRMRTYRALGLTNVLSVAVYRTAKNLGVYTLMTPKGDALQGPFFTNEDAVDTASAAALDYFSFHRFEFPLGPDWQLNPWITNPVPADQRHWSAISDGFSPKIGDIKIIWEPSRFDWMPKWAWQVAQQPSANSLTRIEYWIHDWCVKNPVNQGPNWRCGQETSMRAMNVLLSAKIIGDPFDQPSKGLLEFYAAHMRRVLPTLRYAIAQDNNHGTSEAVALFVLGAYLQEKGEAVQSSLGARCVRMGRRWLENRVKKLIMPDGSFSQHSVTYHRLMLDTLCYAEQFRRDLSQPKFSVAFYQHAVRATEWLAAMTDWESGDAPNLGTNDGAYLFNSLEQPYRDFRPSIALALNVFTGQRLPQAARHVMLSVFSEKDADLPSIMETQSKLYPDGGYCRLVADKLTASLRLPVFNFRPAQSDVHHLDVWHDGINIVRDGGSFCYNTDDPEMIDFFVGSRSHSTVRFDNRDQMPRVSRFLLGDWLTADNIDFDAQNNCVISQYTDSWQARHHRAVNLDNCVVKVTDQLSGFSERAEVRWRLMPAPWQLSGDTISCPGISIQCALPEGAQLSLVEEYESLHYLQCEKVPVLLIVVSAACKVDTVITIDGAVRPFNV